MLLIAVANEMNQHIIMGPHKELVEWHWKCAHIVFKLIQQLMKPRHLRNQKHHDDTKLVHMLLLVIENKHGSTWTCDTPSCAGLLADCTKEPIISDRVRVVRAHFVSSHLVLNSNCQLN
jgi:hypothetical protein